MIDHEEILQALQDRTTWENRQATFYKMRHDGLRRVNKPWPGAADMHFPLSDMLIEKMKPFYISQIFAADTIATFIGENAQSNSYQSSAGQWFDYHLKQRSNFETEIVIGSDKMLQSGKCVIKVYWDAQRKRLKFEAIDPLNLILPPYTGRVNEDLDWFVHVQHYSVHAYKRLSREAGWDTSEETLAAIAAGEERSQAADQVRYTREGITKPANDKKIVVWEVHAREIDGSWRIKTYSPTLPGKQLRPEFGLPYNKGVFGETNPPPPIFELSCELKDRGFYDSRGIAERVGQFEASLCKDWNTQKDYQTLSNSPMFSASQGVPNTANLRFTPGQILPFPLTAVQMPTPPIDIPQGMLGTRTVAEQLIGVPDFGTGSSSGQEKKTAKEVGLIASVMGQGVDLRARIYRKELAHGLTLAWSILCQYACTELEYFVLDSMMQLPAEAMAGKYRIEPNVSGDNWNRSLVVQKAQARFQMFKGDPRIDQDELYRSLLDADDPRLTKRLLVNTGSQAAAQLEDQAQEISIMLLGFPAEIRPTDDDLSHLQSIAGFAQRRTQTGEPLTAETLTLLAQHAQGHAAALRQKNPDVWKQRGPALGAFVQQLQAEAQKAAQAQQAQQANLSPFPAQSPAA
jgi:hypothetical protein